MSTFLFMTIFPSYFLQTKDVNKTFKNQHEFWKLDKTWQNYYPLEHWRFGDERRFVRFFGALAIPNNSAIECPKSILLTGLESFSIAQKIV